MDEKNNETASKPIDGENSQSVENDGNKKKKKPWSKKKKIIVGAAVFLLICSVVSGNSNSTSKTTSNTETTTSAAKAKKSTTSEPKKVKVDKSTLETYINQYAGTTGDNYTPESFQSFSDALSKAQSVDADENATQSEVDSAKSSLISAYGNLKEAFKPENYATPAFTDVARNPDSYKGQKIAFTGKVLQVLEGSTETDLRIATDGGYDDVVFVGFDPSILGGTHVLEDDNVTVYGTCIGQYSYSSTLGAKISLPGLYAEQVVIN